ncbi:MAG: Ig-like domain-containing protein [Lachnospiraceae bacterium]|nr:Ig-like domain-containing protein [Lachnospiraceae bacterium]
MNKRFFYSCLALILSISLVFGSVSVWAEPLDGVGTETGVTDTPEEAPNPGEEETRQETPEGTEPGAEEPEGDTPEAEEPAPAAEEPATEEPVPGAEPSDSVSENAAELPGEESVSEDELPAAEEPDEEIEEEGDAEYLKLLGDIPLEDEPEPLSVLEDGMSVMNAPEVDERAKQVSFNRIDELPELRYQSHGICWAYSTNAVAELDMVVDGVVSKNEIEYSPVHTAYFTSHSNLDGAADPLGGTAGDTSRIKNGKNWLQGGNIIFGTQVMANWTGAVNRSEILDDTVAKEEDVLDPDLQYGIDSCHIQGIYEVSLPEDRLLAKDSIVKHGGISVSYYETDSYYDSSHNSYYCSALKGTNHAVTAVGWDDSFPKENFKNSGSGNGPKENGAWLIRNSWANNGGRDYSHRGYFWLSYEDKSLRDSAYAVDAESVSNYDNNYQYDGTIRFEGGGQKGKTVDKVTAANVFRVRSNQKEDELLKAVGFESYQTVNAEYTVKVYTDLTDPAKPDSGTKAAEESGSFTYSGYYTVKLPEAVRLKPGTVFSVVVTLSKPGGTPKIAVDSGASTEWLDITCHAEEGQSYLLWNGWYDYGKNNGKNIRIKAFTSFDIENPPASVKINRGGSEVTGQTVDLDAGEETLLTAEVLPAECENKNVIWSSSNPSVATVDKDGHVTALKGGSTVISARTELMGKRAKCTVNVTQKVFLEEKEPVKAGSTGVLTATLADGISLNSVRAVEWKSSEEKVATVAAVSANSLSANFTAKSPGKTKITVSVNFTDDSYAKDYIELEVGRPLSGLSFGEKEIVVEEGEEIYVNLSIEPEDAVGYELFWSSDDIGIADITADQFGQVVLYGLSIGETAIHVRNEDSTITASCPVKVAGRLVERVELDPLTLTFEGIGEEGRLQATVIPNDAADTAVTWTSSDKNVASVDDSGLVTARGYGKAVITVKTRDGGHTAKCEVTALKTAEKLEFDTDEVTVGLSGKASLKLNITPEDADLGDFEVSSNNPGVAEYNAGYVYAGAKAGTAVLTASAVYPSGKTVVSQCAVTVKSIPMEELTVSPSSNPVYVGESTTVTVLPSPKNADGGAGFTVGEPEIEILSGEKAPVEVLYGSGTGLFTVKGVEKGDAKLTFYSSGVSGNCVINVRYSTKPVPETVPEYSVVFMNQETELKSIKVKSGNTLEGKTPGEPSGDGVFLGWYHNNSLWNLSLPVRQNLKLYAAFAKESDTGAEKNSGSGLDGALNISEPEKTGSGSIYMVEGQKGSLGEGEWTVKSQSTTGMLKVGKKNGSLQAKKAGTATLECSSGQNAGKTYEVTVIKPKVQLKEGEGKKLTLLVGEAGELVLTGIASENRANYPVTWRSSNSKTAAVIDTSDGNNITASVNAISKGSTTVYACVCGKSYKFRVKVTDTFKQTKDDFNAGRIFMNPLQSATIKHRSFKPKKAKSWSVADTPLEVTEVDKNGNPKKWKNEAVEITKSGKITAVGLGVTELHGVDESGGTMDLTVTVRQVPAKDVVYVGLNKKETIKYYKVKNKKAVWSTDNSGITGPVEKGKVEGLSVGKADVECVYSGFTFSSPVYVEDPKCSVTELDMQVGNKRMLKLTDTTQSVLWTSSNKSVAFVDENGMVYARKPGKATLKVKINGKTCKVKVNVR